MTAARLKHGSGRAAIVPAGHLTRRLAAAGGSIHRIHRLSISLLRQPPFLVRLRAEDMERPPYGVWVFGMERRQW